MSMSVSPGSIVDDALLNALPGAVAAETIAKGAVGSEVRDVLAKRALAFGVEVIGVGLRDIILPGEMKTIR